MLGCSQKLGKYSDRQKTGIVQILNGRFQLVPGILLPDHLKTLQICPVF
jgi:hypothetical protein